MNKKIKIAIKKLRHLRKLIPTRESHMLHHIGAVLFALAIVTIPVQLLYPQDRTLPYVRVNNEALTGLTRRQLIDYLYAKYSDAPLTVKAGDKQVSSRVNEAGLIINYGAAVDEALSYKGWQRVIPFSSVIKAGSSNIRLSVVADEERLITFAHEATKQCYVAPQNAAITIQGEKVKLVSAKSGKWCSFDAIKQQLTTMTVNGQNEIVAEVNEQKPRRGDEAVAPLLAEAQRYIDSGLRVAVIDTFHQVPKATIAGWLELTENDKKQPTIILKNDKVAEYLNGLHNGIYIAPGTTTVYLVDGKEVRRELGRVGQGIDTVVTAARIQEVLFGPAKTQPTAWAAITKLEPNLVYSRNYSHTQAGLDLFLKDLAAEKGGYGIALHEIGGPGRVSSANGGKTFIMASTYKLFVGYAVLKEVEAGRMNWSDEIANGRSADQCFNDMIVVSDNPCAESFGKRIGWSNIQNMVNGMGLASTFMTPGNFRSTAYDEAVFIRKVEAGELLSGDSRTRLLDAMKRQVYRAGIPRGAKGTVANKVGFLEGYLNDAAIVYGRQGTYALVILTNGSSWGQIADAAKRIDTYLNE